MNPDACKDVMDRSRIPYEGVQDISRVAAGLEEISIRKQLPLRQQTDKPVLKYNTSLSKAIHLFNPLEVNGTIKDGSEPGIGSYSSTGMYYTGNVTGISTDPSTFRRQDQINPSQPHSRHSLHQKIRKTTSPSNPYVRPVSATEIAANINGEKSKRMIEAAAAVAPVPTNSLTGSSNSTLQRNSFLRPLSGMAANREKTDTKVTSTTATATYVKQPDPGSESLTKRNGENKSVKNAMFHFASTTSYKPPTPPHIHRAHTNWDSRSISSSPVSQAAEKTTPSYLSSKPYSETVTFINQESSRETHIQNHVSEQQSDAKQFSQGIKQNGSPDIPTLKKMPVTNTLTGAVYYRKSSITATESEEISKKSTTPQKTSTTDTKTVNNVLNQQVTQSSNIALSPDQKSTQSMQRPSNSRPTLERSNASIQFHSKPPQTQNLKKSLSSEKKEMVREKSDLVKSNRYKKTDKTVPPKLVVKQTIPSGSPNGREKIIGLKLVEQRPMGDGAPSRVTVQKERPKGTINNNDSEEDDEFDEDDNIDGEDDLDEDDDCYEEDGDECSGTTVSGERLPGDGEASFDELDEEDDGLAAFEDNASDGGSECYSINSTSTLGHRSASGRPLTAHSAGSIKNTATMTDLEGKMKSLSTRPATAANQVIIKPFFRHSMFKRIPPSINFVGEGEKTEQIPWELRKLLKWKMSPITPIVVKTALARVGFRITKRNHDWLGCFGKHMKAICFKPLREYQKLNHFPGSFQIGRKDRLWRNLSKMQLHHGKKEFNFFPQTYVLPCDLKQLKRAWEDGNSKQKWIIKPPASARGIGIKVIGKWTQIPRRKPVIVQRYLSRPYLINDSKFDMRVYVYVSSYDPLRIYVYDDGLARFASCKYSSSMKSLNNKYMHLTNYSINKRNVGYQSNTDNTVCQGHKWSLKSLWNYMKRQGVNTNQVWDSVKDLVVKTIISGDASINSMTKSNCRSRYVAHELFGFDVLLDESLKPWILEVNISPSLHSNSQLDINIKGGMIKDLMNIAGFRLPDERDVTHNGSNSEFSAHIPSNKYCMDKRLFTNQLAPDERAKHAYYCQKFQDELRYNAYREAEIKGGGDVPFVMSYQAKIFKQVMQSILDTITPDDMRHLCEAIDEDSRKGNFQRLFPTPQTHKYLRFFEQPRYYNLLLDQWVLRYNRMEQRGIMLLQSFCEEGIHLENPTGNSRHQWTPPNSSVTALRLSDGRVAPGPPSIRGSKMDLIKSARKYACCGEQKDPTKSHEVFDKLNMWQFSKVGKFLSFSPHTVFHWSSCLTQSVTSGPSAPTSNYELGSEPNIFIQTLSPPQSSCHSCGKRRSYSI